IAPIFGGGVFDHYAVDVGADGVYTDGGAGEHLVGEAAGGVGQEEGDEIAHEEGEGGLYREVGIVQVEGDDAYFAPGLLADDDQGATIAGEHGAAPGRQFELRCPGDVQR